MANLPLVRRRLRGKLKNSPTPADLDDLCSSVVRRVYTAALRTFRAAGDREVIAYALTVADHLAQRRGAEDRRCNAVLRLIARQGEDRALRGPSERDLAAHLKMLSDAITDPADRDLLHRRLRGHRYALIAEQAGLTEATLRKRWARLRNFLSRLLRSHALPEPRHGR